MNNTLYQLKMARDLLKDLGEYYEEGSYDGVRPLTPRAAQVELAILRTIDRLMNVIDD